MIPNFFYFPFVQNYLKDKVLCSVATTEKRVALTFDDGPNPRHTPQPLDLLARKGIPATFFLVGRRVRRYPELAARIAGDGHEVGNHGLSHIPILFLPPAAIVREIRKTEELIVTATGRKPLYFRPPMGWCSRKGIQTVQALGYRPVIGSIHPRDSSRPGTDAIVEHTLSRVGPGSIIILHDGGWLNRVDRTQSVEAADRLTDVLGEMGYRFQTLSDLAGVNPL